jgi:protein O-mannosyl-transferase
MLAAAGLIVLAGTAAYANSFHGVFVFDDITSIVENPTIQRLWPLSGVVSPLADGRTVSGRPLLNLSLAVDYAICGDRTWGATAMPPGRVRGVSRQLVDLLA